MRARLVTYGILLLSLVPALIAGAVSGLPAAATTYMVTLLVGGGLYSLLAWLLNWPRLRWDSLPVIDGWLP
jgi:hypothetical protein